MQQWWETLKRSLRYNYLRVMRLKASTHAVAMGLAVGVFVGFLPVIPFQTVIALAFAFVFRASKIPAALGTWISNPVNLIPFYTMLYYVGRFFMPVDTPELDFHHLELESMIQQGWGLVVVMFTGGVILGVPGAFVTYVVSFRIVNSYRQKRMIRLIKKYQKKKAERELAAAAAGQGGLDSQLTNSAGGAADSVAAMRDSGKASGISSDSSH
ncbi:DUF2062 domain-containing protein [Desulfovibrio mangrovi]|uniref:DUF2062 domain-containing protein n=1 Tax=Desulfovibrio mangrovi TaxID=2976983 RepID=UPI002246176E|nr:DUF2062 domain-containing protein [Desulfovibrio mangrovi]UZP68391.1 DUF2062 domain-containing protein [Desulfovibrio mangrovi]